MRDPGWRPWCFAVTGLLAIALTLNSSPAAAVPGKRHGKVRISAHVKGTLTIVVASDQALAVTKSNVEYGLSLDRIDGRDVWTAVVKPL